MSVSTLPIDLLSFGFQWPTSLQPDEARAWINPKRVRSGLFLMAALPRPGGRGAGLIAARPRLFEKDGEIQRALDAFCAVDTGAAEVIASRRYPDDLVRVKIRFGHADRYGVDGAVLIGDAAHAVTPAGGQGANSSIADARVLSQVILGGESSLIAAFERRRRPANARALRLSRAASWMMSLPDFALSAPIPFAFRFLNTFPGLFARGLRFASTAFVENTDH
jgi:2-polyprenyl-6-methoxyphenol hydroxylase-like FAD-dependent oxidoreductase